MPLFAARVAQNGLWKEDFMAAKKKTVRAAKKPAKKAAKNGAARRPERRKKPQGSALSTLERSRLLKPRKEYVSLIEQVLATWKDNPSLRVPGLTRAKLAALLSAAEKASAREQALVRQMEARLRPLADARIMAESELWRALLDTNAQIKVHARTDAAVGRAFGFLGVAFTTRKSDSDEADSAED
jgi:hypothetical protein